MHRQLLAPCALLLMLAAGGNAARSFSDAATVASADPAPPVWPDAYTVEFVVSMPHFYITQPQGLSIPVKAWYDASGRRSKIESFGGTDTVIFTKEHEYEVHPRIDKLTCWVDSDLASSGSVNGLLGDDTPILPDLSKYEYTGSLVIDGVEAHIWQLQFKEGEAVNTYNFYTSAATGAPLKFHMFGYNVIAIGHYDEYIYDFKSYTTGPDDAAFQVPALCSNGSQRVRTERRGSLSRQMAMLMPGARSPPTLSAAVDVAHAHWTLLTGRTHATSEGELQQRQARFRLAHQKVAAHNANPDKTYTMQLGRFADWSEEELYGTMLPDAWRRKQGKPSLREIARAEALKREPHAYDPIGKFKPRMRRSELPREVDWRGTGADAGVKDQGMCGSCWAFGATAAMEGAWYVQTGEKRSFSEQQLVDCAYDWGNNGCDGGDAKPAFNYVAHSGGIALEQDYYYHSTGDYCMASNFTRVGQFDGFLQVKPRDELAMMEAVYTMGPLAVGVDPSPDSFLYYKEGVYTDKDCNVNHLDHQVILFGYGTTDDGIDYWLVKNMWSKFWGADGYIKIARGRDDCGIATDGNIAAVSKASLRAGAGSRRLEAIRKW